MGVSPVKPVHLKEENDIMRDKHRTCSDMGRDENSRGAILPLAAVGAASLLGVMGLSLDVGNVFVARQELHAAAEAASLAGGTALSQGTTLPNFSLASTNASAALTQLKNQSNGTNVVSATVTTGGYDLSGTLKGLQVPYVPGGTQAPAVQVSVTKSGVNGVVNTFFAKVLGINTFTPKSSAIAVGNYSPASAAPGQVLPLAIPQAVITALWNPVTNQPRTATSTQSIMVSGSGPSQTSGQPYTVRIWDNGCGASYTQTIPGGGALPAVTGAWHSYSSSNNQDLCQLSWGGSGNGVGGQQGQGFRSGQDQYGQRWSGQGGSSSSSSLSTPIFNANEMNIKDTVQLCSQSDAVTTRQNVVSACQGGNFAGYVPVVDNCSNAGGQTSSASTIQSFAAIKVVGSGAQTLSTGHQSVTCGYVDIQMIPPGKTQVSQSVDPVSGITNSNTFSCTLQGKGAAQTSYVTGAAKVVD
jgi:Flp pilus assembly protein TadG